MIDQFADVKELVRTLYKDEQGNPLILTDGQAEIFDAILRKRNPRTQVMCHTRYGKSLVIALAVLTRAATYPEKWSIVSGTKDRAKIIMDYVIGHIFDNPYTAGRFVRDKGENDTDIKRHRNKSHITFDIDGQMSDVYITSAKDAIGKGASNVVEDEASLIPDNEHALVMRMLADQKENFLCKIGNPFLRNHFLRSHNDPEYRKINIDCHRSALEGRITNELIEEMSQFSYFGVLFENKFPRAEDVDEDGWMFLLNDADIEAAVKRDVQPYGPNKLGVDVARGGRNYNVWVIRNANTAFVVARDRDNDLMSVAAKTMEFAKQYGVQANEIYIDDTGVGGGVSDRLRELGWKINAVRLGERAENSKDYINIRAEAYAGTEGLMNWIKRGGKLEPHKDWIELTGIRYKKDSSGRTKIESKEDMRARGFESPDVADGLMLTFCRKSVIIMKSQSEFGGVEEFIKGLG